MKKITKGNFGYISYEKKKRFLITLILLAVPVFIFVTAYIYFGTNKTLWSILAIVGCLPACKSMVGMIVMFMQKPTEQQIYDEIAAHSGDLTMAYELVVTTYDKNSYIDAVAICGNTVVAYSSHKDTDAAFAANHIQKILHHNGYKADVKVLKDVKPFLERLDSMNEHKASLEADIPFTPDERYPDLSRNDLIKHTILAISL
ncbi:MAG: hypothetical protein PHS82_11980 [Lachnospiraceae bacterium]|nr:hypothetical protein [Lachnospiraceae bacterium]